MPAGRPRTPLETMQMRAKGDGREPGGRKFSDRVKGELVPTKRSADGTIDKRVIRPPKYLKTRGRMEWYSLWETGDAWLHPKHDYRWVEMVARNYDLIEYFLIEIDKIGPIVKGSAGQDAANPLYNEIKRCEATIQTCLVQLGFGPVARAKLGLKVAQAETAMHGLAALQQRSDDHHKA